MPTAPEIGVLEVDHPDVVLSDELLGLFKAVKHVPHSSRRP
jgi:hypothetical protein